MSSEQTRGRAAQSPDEGLDHASGTGAPGADDAAVLDPCPGTGPTPRAVTGLFLCPPSPEPTDKNLPPIHGPNIKPGPPTPRFHPEKQRNDCS